MSCFVGAPRILQAVCADNLFPSLRYFREVRSSDGEPIRGYGMAYVISFIAILSGNINFIAPIITNFFMITYALMNYSCFVWGISKSPGWRPTFKYYHPYVSLLASMECIVLMFLIDWRMALGTVVLGTVMYKYVEYTSPDVNWGTARQAVAYTDACKYLAKKQHAETHAKVERPTFLIFDEDLKDLQELFSLAKALNYARGLIMVGDVVIGDSFDTKALKTFATRRKLRTNERIPENIQNDKYSIVESCIATNFLQGVHTILQTAGIGSIRPNVLLLNMKDSLSPRNKPRWISMSSAALKQGCGVAMMKGSIDWKEKKREGYIDIWWLYDDGGLTLMIAYLLQKNPLWKGCKLRIMALEELGMQDKTELVRLMTSFRIDADVVSVRSNTRPSIMFCKDDGASSEVFANPLDNTEKLKKKAEELFPAFVDDIDQGTAATLSPISVKVPFRRNLSNSTCQSERKEDIEELEKMELELGPESPIKTAPETPERDGEVPRFASVSTGALLSSAVGLDEGKPNVYLETRKPNENESNIPHLPVLLSSPSDRKGSASTSKLYNMKGKEKEISAFGVKKLKKYHRLGELVNQSRNSELTIVTMPFPRPQYKWWEYEQIIKYLSPPGMNILFVRGNQRQMLTFAL